jgi:hypothetical protein
MPVSIAAASAMPESVCAHIHSVRCQQRERSAKQEPARSFSSQGVGETLAGGHANARAHELHRGHQQLVQESSPEKRRAHLRAGDGVSGHSGWIVVGRAGDESRPESGKEATDDARSMSILHDDREVCGAHVDRVSLASPRYSFGFSIA